MLTIKKKRTKKRRCRSLPPSPPKLRFVYEDLLEETITKLSEIQIKK